MVLTKSMVKQSGTIGCVLMELNLVYDVACCLSGPILYASTAHRSLSESTARHSFDDENHITVHVFCAIITSTSIIQFIITIKNVINL